MVLQKYKIDVILDLVFITLMIYVCNFNGLIILLIGVLLIFI